MKKGNASANANKASARDTAVVPASLQGGVADLRGREARSKRSPDPNRPGARGRASAARRRHTVHARARSPGTFPAPGAVERQRRSARSRSAQCGKTRGLQLAIDPINVERNMTDLIAGLRVLTHLDRPEREEEAEAFYEKWKDDPLVTDKWLALQANAKRENAIEDVKRLMEHSAFNRRNPNRIRSLIGAFAMGISRASIVRMERVTNCWRIS